MALTPRKHASEPASSFAGYIMPTLYANGLEPGRRLDANAQFEADGDTYSGSIESQDVVVQPTGSVKAVWVLAALTGGEAGTLHLWLSEPSEAYDKPPIATSYGPAETFIRVP